MPSIFNADSVVEEQIRQGKLTALEVAFYERQDVGLGELVEVLDAARPRNSSRPTAT